MAPEPAWADTASAAGAQRGSCAEGPVVRDRVVLEVGVLDRVVLEFGAVAVLVGGDRRVGEDAVVAPVRPGVGEVDGRAEGDAVAPVVWAVATVVAAEPEDGVGPWSAADLLVPQPLTSAAIATRPTPTKAPLRRRQQGMSADRSLSRPPPGIS